jgi:hypothetical protein
MRFVFTVSRFTDDEKQHIFHRIRLRSIDLTIVGKSASKTCAAALYTGILSIQTKSLYEYSERISETSIIYSSLRHGEY